MRLFICHAQKETYIIEHLANDLREMSHDVWYDQHQVGWTYLLDEIDACDVFIYALSSDAVKSRKCRNEHRYARDLGKPVLPLMIREASLVGISREEHAIDARRLHPNDIAATLEPRLESLPQTSGSPKAKRPGQNQGLPLNDPRRIPVYVAISLLLWGTLGMCGVLQIISSEERPTPIPFFIPTIDPNATPIPTQPISINQMTATWVIHNATQTQIAIETMTVEPTSTIPESRLTATANILAATQTEHTIRIMSATPAPLTESQMTATVIIRGATQTQSAIETIAAGGVPGSGE
jgi:hypothetical protein